MEIEVLEQKESVLRFVLRGSHTAFGNALRRAMIADVPVMAIDDLVIVENSSVLYDEVIAHRLGLIPMKTDLDSFVRREECDCKSELGCNKCTASFTLEAEAVDRVVTVYSGDLKSESSVVPVSNRIPIVKLAQYQKLKLEAYARLGVGREHAKWQPVSGCAYKYVPKVTLKAENLANPEEVANWCPRDVYQFSSESGITVADEMACTMCMDCVDHAVPVDPKKPFPVKIEGDDTSFIFSVESTGAMAATRIIEEAARVIEAKAQELSKLVKSEMD